MKILFLSDTHGNLNTFINDINLSTIELIILLGDNDIDDLKILKGINIPKIGILGNHKFRSEDMKTSVLGEYGIEDIAFKRYEFNGVSFYGIDGQVSYQLVEDMQDKNNKFKIFNPNINIEIDKYMDKRSKLFNEEGIDFLISHFPARGIMDSNSFSHRGLNLIRDYIEFKKPKYFMHGHLHNPGVIEFGSTKIIQVFEGLVF